MRFEASSGGCSRPPCTERVSKSLSLQSATGSQDSNQMWVSQLRVWPPASLVLGAGQSAAAMEQRQISSTHAGKSVGSQALDPVSINDHRTITRTS